jgi:iron uptake system component EfeO
VLVAIAALRPNSPFVPGSYATTTGPAVAGVQVSAGEGDCGAGWDGGAAGPVTLAFNNTGFTMADVFIQDSATSKVYGELEQLGESSSRALTLSLPAGTYVVTCVHDEDGAFHSAPVTVTGSYDGALTPGVLPVTIGDVVAPIAAYQKWVQSRVPVLQRQLATLGTDLRRGRVAASEKAWLTAHMTYETMGAAYDAFGAINDDIDAMPTVGVSPVTDPHLRGFHKVEALLWHGRRPASIAPYVTAMSKAVATLGHEFGTTLVMAPIDIGLRSHEILENALQFELTGRTDAGSHSELATIEANIEGTRHALAPLEPLLTPRDPDLPATRSWLDRLQRLVESYHHGSSWTPLSALTPRQHETLDATLSQTLEYLSEVAVITDPVPPLNS